MGLLTTNQFGGFPPMRFRNGMSGLAGGPWDSFSSSRYLERCNPGLKSQASSEASLVMGAFQRADQKLTQTQRELDLLGSRLDQMGVDPYESLESAQIMDDIEGARSAIADFRGQLAQAFNAYSSELSTAFGKGNCPLVPPYKSGAAFVDKVRKVETAISGLTQGLAARLSTVERQIKRKKTEQAQVASAEAERLRIEELRLQRQQELEERRYQDQLRREEEARRYEAEQRQRELEYQQALQQQEAERRAEERALEQERIERERALEQARIDAELRREEMAIAAEERRLALEQERALREEEREIRRQEQEAELKRLMLMQELAASGVPTPLAPAGAASLAPQLPAAALPTLAPQGFPTFPGAAAFPQAPGYAATLPVPTAAPAAAPSPQAPVPPGYAAQIPSYQQSAPVTQPGAPAPGGFQWASFDPSNELFGIGALAPTSNPNLRGAQVDDEYRLIGQGNGFQFIHLSTSRAVTNEFRGGAVFTEAELYQGAIIDPVTRQVIYVPPVENRVASRAATQALEEERTQRAQALEEERTQRAIATGIFGTLQEVARGAGGYLTAREQRRAGGRAGGGALYVDAPLPPPRRSSGIGPMLLVGALGVGAIALAVSTGGGDKKKDEK